MYWHYINTQYFPLWMLLAAKDPPAAFAQTCDNLRSQLSSSATRLNRLELDSVGNTYMLKKQPECIQSPNDRTENEKQQLSVDQLIAVTEEELRESRQDLFSVERSAGERMLAALVPAVDGPGLCSGGLAQYGPEVCYKYTKSELDTLLEYARSVEGVDDSDLLRDSVYPNAVDYKYYDLAEKRRRRKNVSSAEGTVAARKKDVFKKRSQTFSMGTRSKARVGKDKSADGGKAESKFQVQQLYIERSKAKGSAECQVCGGSRSDPTNRIITCSVRNLFLTGLFSIVKRPPTKTATERS